MGSLPYPKLMLPRLFSEDDLRWAETCGREGVPLADVMPIAMESWDRALDHWREIYEIRRAAFASLGLTKRHRAFTGEGDVTYIHGIERYAREQAGVWPQHLGGDTSTENAERLYELLKLNEEDYRPDPGKCWREAIDTVASAGRRRRRDVHLIRRRQADRIPF